MPNPRANRPLTLDQVTADLKSLSQPAFYPRVGNIQARGMRSPQPQPMREQTGPEMPQWGDTDLSVPTRANRAMSQRLSEQDVLERSRANANMSPLERAGAAMQAARLAGSGLTQLALSMPTRIRSGDQAADEYIAENIYQPTIPKATEYVSDLGEMLEQLETRYKLPPIMPELLAFQEMAGPAARQAAKTGTKAGKAAGMNALQAINDAMVYQTGPLSQGPLSALAPRSSMNIVPVDVAKRIKMETQLPTSPEFSAAVQNTPGAELTPEGLKMSLQRFQKPEQGGDMSVRQGVFYLPKGSPNVRHYKKPKTQYGGKEEITGDTLVRNPLFVKGSTGGKAPEAAFDQLMGKGASRKLADDIFGVVSINNRGLQEEKIAGLMSQYGLDPEDAWHILHNSQDGNQLRYALQERIIGDAARKAGHDAILGYSKGRGDKGEFLSELFDVREADYPTKSGDYRLNPEFELNPEEGMAAGGLLKGIKAARKGALNAERSMPARGALSFADEPMAGPSVIKEKGGNWLSGGVERAVKPLKRRVETENIANYTPEQIKRLMESGSLPRNDALNKWIDRNLTNYIKKEMATPEDPVRRLAEEGITHMPANEIDFANAFLPEKLALKRMNAGFPTQDIGKSPAAQGWERITDELVNVAPASEHTRPLTPSEIRQGVKSTTEADPWLNKVDPNTPIYYPENMDSLARDLGFDHIVDVLKEDLATGRIRPEQLSKVSIEQAVRRTHEYDQEKAKKMAEAAIKQTEGMPLHKEYPEGYKWVELAPPKMPDVLPEGWSEPVQKGNSLQTVSPEGKIVLGFDLPDLVKNIYRRHPETPGNPEKVLEDALKYEGDTMGHCVGGYCPDVLEGRKRIYSLRDKRGEPHVTIEVQPKKRSSASRDAPIDASEYQKWISEELPPVIVQIKGKGNRAPKEEYLPFVQDFVKGGKWSDVGDLHNTQLTHIEDVPEVKQYRAAGMELPSYVTDKERDDLIYEYLKKTRPASDPDFMQSEYGFPPPEDGMKHGGSVHISDNPDTMMMELGDQHFGIGGKAVKPVVKSAKSNLVIKNKPGIIVSKLIDEDPDIAKRLGAEARAKRQAAIEAEGQRKQLAAQTQPSVGYRPSTPQKPDPLVGTRFVNEPEFGLNPNEPFDIAKFKGGSGMVLPWDSQSRNVKTTQVSGVDLPNQIFDVTHGGIPYAFDTAHVKKGIAGASGEDISKRIKTRADTAVGESIGRGGTGELLHFPITMGFRAEDYALPYSEFSFDIINHKLMTGELTPKEVDELTKMVRNFEPPKYKGKKPFAEFAGFTSPEGLNQIYTGEGLKVPPGELRKAIADRMIWQKGSQEKLGFNAEDLMNATTYEPLRGVDKGFIGSTVMRNSPGGMRLSPSAGKYPYDTDFSGEHLGRLEDLIDVEALFHRTLNPIKRELITRENLKPYNKESLRNAAIGAIEKRNEGISQPIDQQFLDDYADYLNELKKPHEYRKGGAITAKRDGQKFKPGKKPDQILKHGQAMPRGKDPEVDIGQMVPHMSAGGKLSKVALEAIQRMKAMRPEIAAKSSLEQKALTENTAKYARDIQPFTMTDEEVAAEIKRLESKGMAGGGEVNADDLILEERRL